jgi:cytochrome c oxidase subunit IV
MAEKGKKGKGAGGGAKKSSAEKAPAEKAETKAETNERAVAAKPAAHAREEAHGEDKPEAAGGHGVGHGAGQGHKVDRREYWIIFGVLFALTVLEVGVAQIPGISRGLMALALIGLAVTKAACVGLFYMHLKHETKILKLTVALPFAAPAVYALVLIGDAAWRLARW